MMQTTVTGEPHEDEAEDHSHHVHHDGKCEGDFMGAPKDWIERLGRNFYISEHTHLESDGDEREILPWLQISADLDPQRVETYTVAAYWLRNRLGKPKEAAQFLRAGLRANPQSYEILFELGRVAYENRRDSDAARNIWELALRRWREQEQGKSEPNDFLHQQIVGQLAELEEQAGNWDAAKAYLEELKKYSPSPQEIQKQIDEMIREHSLPVGSQPVPVSGVK